jgi:signal transduction histidine kinase/ligand-binding sensor domain-containing protein
MIRVSVGREIFLASLMVFTGALPAIAGTAMDSPHYSIRHWLREDGLPQNSVTAVTQTRDGYIWLGTYNGLARFDGARFERFDSGNVPEMSDSRVTSLFEDGKGTLWIGHETGDLTSYANGHFKVAGEKLAWSKRKIVDIGADEAGEVWLFNEGGLLARVSDGLVLKPETGKETNLIEMAVSRAGTIWVGCEGRVSVLHDGGLAPLAFDEGATNTLVSSIGASRDGGLWMTMDGRVRKWLDGRWTGDGCADPYAGAAFLKLMETRNGILAGATSDHGLALIGLDGKISTFDHTCGAASDWVMDVCEDREGDFWIGTGGNGLALVRQSCVENAAPPDAWQGRSILAVGFDRKGEMWVGTEGAGLYRCQEGAWTNYSRGQGLDNPYVWSVAEDMAGNLWAGTWGGGLFMKKEGRFELLESLSGMILPVPALYPSRKGGVWAGTGMGLLRCDASGNTTWYAREAEPAKRDVRCVIETPSGTAWFGTTGGGLFSLDAGGLRKYSKEEGIPGNFVQCLCEDGDGAIWAGTSAGLCRFKEGHFATITKKQGLPDNFICDIEDDGLGDLWMSSYNGIFRVAKTELQECADGRKAFVNCFALGIGDGMPTLECTRGGCRGPDGRLWFPTCRGLVSVDPRQIATNQLPPPVLIEGMLVDTAPAVVPSGSGRLEIPPGQHRFEFHYTGLSFAAPEKVRFKYRLDSLEGEWIDAGTKRAAEYPYIPPGNYIFRVTACNNDGVWNEEGASLAFTVLPYFWQTTTFRVAGLSGIILMTGGGVWYGTRRRLRRKMEIMERQQAVERERTRIAKDIHDDLGSSLTRINLLSQTARRDMDDSPQTVKNLDQICTTARELTRAMDEIVWAVDPQHDSLDSLASYLGKLINELTANSGIRCRLDFPVFLPAWPVTADLRHNLFLAFKEAMHNVLKHSRATEVRVSFAIEPSSFAVKIEDDGCGFDTGMLSATPPPGVYPRPRLNGLVNMRRRLEEIGGRCDIQSGPGRGTVVTFILPAKDIPQ